jgi:formate hydrogenlyase subunit 3/multisubunit Na+/H+ antiporter MnhD subunit
VRLLGLVLLVAGGIGAVRALRGLFEEKRPRDVGFALIAPLAIATALTGALLLLVPGFFAS